MKKIFTDEQIQYIKENYQNMSYAQIAKNLGNYTERQVRGKINGLGLSKLRKFNKSYFSRIDAPDKAYWLGLLYADGWVIYNKKTRNYECSIELQSTDSYLLEELANAIGGVHKVRLFSKNTEFNGYAYQSDMASLRIYSKQITEDLISHGVVENKTSAAQYPACNKFFRDFVRGYLDGDGCIYIDTAKPTAPVVQFTCSNEKFLTYLSDQIKKEIGVSGHIYKEKDRKYRLMFFKRDDTLALLNWIYYDENLPMLKRKYQKYNLAHGLAA